MTRKKRMENSAARAKAKCESDARIRGWLDELAERLAGKRRPSTPGLYSNRVESYLDKMQKRICRRNLMPNKLRGAK